MEQETEKPDKHLGMFRFYGNMSSNLFEDTTF
jgi:hypothetical protein